MEANKTETSKMENARQGFNFMHGRNFFLANMEANKKITAKGAAHCCKTKGNYEQKIFCKTNIQPSKKIAFHGGLSRAHMPE